MEAVRAILGSFHISWDNVIYQAKTYVLILMGYGGIESYGMWGTLAFIVFGFWLFLVSRDLEKDKLGPNH